MSNTEKLRDKLVDMFREQMTDEQFKNFVFKFIGAEALAEYVERELDGASPCQLKSYINLAKSYFKKEKTCKK